MAKKKINSLLSLFVITGDNSQNNAKALEDRRYNIYEDAYIGQLNMTRTYDSVFSNYLNEIFVETTPKYTSIEDLTYLSYAYICNKSVVKPTADCEMYINSDGEINFKYDFEQHLHGDVEISKSLPIDDISLYLRSINNSLYNKQKYYHSFSELQYLSNEGVHYTWAPAGTVISDTVDNIDYNMGDGDFISYFSYSVKLQKEEWNEATGTYSYVYEDKYDEEGNPVRTPVYETKNKIDYLDYYRDTVKEKLSIMTDNFVSNVKPEMYSYYIYELDGTIPFVMKSYTFGQTIVNGRVNYDGEFNNWFNNRITFKTEKLPENAEFANIVPGEKYWFNIAYNVNKDSKFESERLYLDNEYENEISFKFRNVNVDNNEYSILSPYKIKRLDLSPIAEYIYGDLDLTSEYFKKVNSTDYVLTNWNKEKGNMLEELIIGKDVNTVCKIKNIKGLNEFKNLKLIDLRGCDELQSNPDISELPDITDIDFHKTNITVFKPAKGAKLTNVNLPDSIESIILNDVSINGDFLYNISDTLTTLEFNNVIGLDTYEFIHTWLQSLKDANKLDSGLVNYVNLNGVDWEFVDYKDLLDLKVIELNEFTGKVEVYGIGFMPYIYRKEYLKLVDAFGRKYINNDNKEDLNIIVELQPDAFDLNISLIEEYEEIRQEQNEYGELETIVEVKERELANTIAVILDTVSGNSLLNLVEDNKEYFTKIKCEDFINNNKINIGWQIKLNKALDLPTNTENPKILNEGDILLYNKDTLVIVNKTISNINQNFTKLGSINNADDLVTIINNIESWFITLEYSETEIQPSPIKDRKNFIDVDYDDTDNLFNKEISDENVIEVEYNSTKKTVDLFEKEYLTNNEIDVEFN